MLRLFVFLTFLFVLFCGLSALLTGSPLTWIDHLDCLLGKGDFSICVLSSCILVVSSSVKRINFCPVCNQKYARQNNESGTAYKVCLNCRNHVMGHITCDNAKSGKIRLGYKMYNWYVRYGDNNKPYIAYVRKENNALIPLSDKYLRAITLTLWPND